jgi:hypothetical protein
VFRCRCCVGEMGFEKVSESGSDACAQGDCLCETFCLENEIVRLNVRLRFVAVCYLGMPRLRPFLRKARRGTV